MSRHILITGGAGFIGSHLADELLAQGHRVRALDVLSPQVHPNRSRPDYLSSEVELQIGDVRDPATVVRALHGIEAVYHFAAMVGVGQSMYQVADYTGVNGLGTAVLLQALIEQPVERLVVASSMSIYGEGIYRAPDGSIAVPVERPIEQLRAGDWQVRNAAGDVLTPAPTPESKPPSLRSIYALSKFDQERMCLMIGEAYRIPTVALRFFNVYGTRQALSNPYTGVLAIFASRYLNRRPPVIFEDGLQRRDFVSVYDVARACRLALTAASATSGALNVGSGEHLTIREVATRMAAALGLDGIAPEITAQYRVGDVRHCFADISLARDRLGYEPQVTLDEGLVELAEWLQGQQADDRVGTARQELAARGLTV
jgi:dTDP-L-rhamnose 4-epimerase